MRDLMVIEVFKVWFGSCFSSPDFGEFSVMSAAPAAALLEQTSTLVLTTEPLHAPLLEVEL